MTAQAYPLQWPAGWSRTRSPEWSRFKTRSPGLVRDELVREIERLGGRNIVISTNIPLRQDGYPMANRRAPDDQGVAVYFTMRRKGKPKQMVFACDRWASVTENMRAITKTIEAIRGIERWGASDMMERAFTGFVQLEDASNRHWRSVLGLRQNHVSLSDVETRYRELAHKAHPDRGGSDAAMAMLNKAREDARAELNA